jgi:hypothetical protein
MRPATGQVIIPALSVLLAFPPTTSSQDMTAEHVLDRLEGAINGIKSFEVKLTGIVRRHIVTTTTEEPDPQDPRKKRHVATGRRKLLQREQPPTEKEMFGQTCGRGKVRIDFLGTGQDKPGMFSPGVLIEDAVTRRFWNPGEKSLSIQESDPLDACGGMDYRTTFSTWMGALALVQCLRERNHVTLAETPGIVLDAKPQPGANVSLPLWGFRVEIDRPHGFLPAAVETWMPVKGKPVRSMRREINKWKLVDAVWVPIKATSTYYLVDPKFPDLIGEISAVVVMEVDEASSTWNTEIPAERFNLPIPPGSRVVDATKGITYTTGTPDPGDNLDDAAEGATYLVPDSTVVESLETMSVMWAGTPEKPGNTRAGERLLNGRRTVEPAAQAAVSLAGRP